MKVAMIGLRGIPAKSGGVETVVENLAPRLVKLGCDVTVYCRTPYCRTRPESWKGVKLRYMNTINTKYTETIIHSALSTFDASFEKYDIIHFHAMGNAVFSLFPRLAGKKTILTIHGLDYEREKWGLLGTAYLKFGKFLSKHFPNSVISCSKKIQRIYEDEGKAVKFIPNGVEIQPRIKISRLKKYGLKKDSYLLFLSRIVPEKGLEYLIKAFRELKTDKKLIIAGDSTHTDSYLDKMKKLAQDDGRIIFTGPLYGKEKAEAFSNAYLFILPSTIEGMPVVLLEAMSYGLFSVVSDIEENVDVIESDYGRSFRSKDPVSLRKSLEFALSDKDTIKKIGKKSKKMVKERYSWDNIAKMTLEVYHEVIQ